MAEERMQWDGSSPSKTHPFGSAVLTQVAALAWPEAYEPEHLPALGAQRGVTTPPLATTEFVRFSVVLPVIL